MAYMLNEDRAMRGPMTGRQKVANALMESGGNTAPIQSWTQGLARLGEGVMGGMMNRPDGAPVGTGGQMTAPVDGPSPMDIRPPGAMSMPPAMNAPYQRSAMGAPPPVQPAMQPTMNGMQPIGMSRIQQMPPKRPFGYGVGNGGVGAGMGGFGPGGTPGAVGTFGGGTAAGVY